MLEQASSDVLILLDCCAAASSTSGAGNGLTELLAACGFETWAPGVGEHSFTRSLIDELKYWSRRRPMSVVKLHSEVLARIKYWKPRYAMAENGERRKTPIYICLANEGKERSIQLYPITHGNPLTLRTTSPQPHSSNSDGSDNDLMLSAALSSRTSLQSENGVDYQGPKVLISVALEEDQLLHTGAWLEWLESVPAVAKAARIEGVYKSDSTLLLLTLPIETWDMFPADAAVSFIAFVSSCNLIKYPRPSPLGATNSAKLMQTSAVSASRPDLRDVLSINNTAEEVATLSDPLALLARYTTTFLIDDTDRYVNDWKAMKRVLIKCTTVVLRAHATCNIRFTNSALCIDGVSDISEVEKVHWDQDWARETNLRYGLRTVAKRVISYIDDHSHSLKSPELTDAHSSLNLVVFLTEKSNDDYETFFQNISHNIRKRRLRIQLVQVHGHGGLHSKVWKDIWAPELEGRVLVSLH